MTGPLLDYRTPFISAFQTIPTRHNIDLIQILEVIFHFAQLNPEFVDFNCQQNPESIQTIYTVQLH
jgi:hypothetical protein